MSKFYSIAYKILDLIPYSKYLPRDKSAHFLGGAILAMPAAYLGYYEIAVIFVAILAGIKEGIDWWSNRKLKQQGLTPVHGVDFWDWAVSILGAALPVTLHYLIIQS